MFYIIYVFPANFPALVFPELLLANVKAFRQFRHILCSYFGGLLKLSGFNSTFYFFWNFIS